MDDSVLAGAMMAASSMARCWVRLPFTIAAVAAIALAVAAVSEYGCCGCCGCCAHVATIAAVVILLLLLRLLRLLCSCCGGSSGVLCGGRVCACMQARMLEMCVYAGGAGGEGGGSRVGGRNWS